MANPTSSGAPAERWLAATLAVIPLVYLLTDHSWTPVFWHYSVTLLAAIVIYAVAYVMFLQSYRWTLPAGLVQLRTRVVVVGLGVVVGVLGAELALWALDDRPSIVTQRLRGYAPDPDTGYVYLSNYEQKIVTLESATSWHSNSLGLRSNRDYGPKRDGVVRILALGDSFTVNTPVEAADTWPGVLEQRLANTGPAGTAFEVINGGHAGYGTMQASRWYRKYGLDLQADMVLVAMTPNDITDNGQEPPGPGVLTAVDGYLAWRGYGLRKRHSKFVHRERWYSLPGWVERSRLRRLVTTVSFEKYQGPALAACHIELDPAEKRLHELTERYLLEIRDLAQSQGASFGLLLITFREQLGEMAPGYSGRIFGERWARFAETHRIPVVDTYRPFLEHAGEPPLFWRWDNHYTEEGSRVAGEAAGELVRQTLSRESSRPR